MENDINRFFLFSQYFLLLFLFLLNVLYIFVFYLTIFAARVAFLLIVQQEMGNNYQINKIVLWFLTAFFVGAWRLGF